MRSRNAIKREYAYLDPEAQGLQLKDAVLRYAYAQTSPSRPTCSGVLHLPHRHARRDRASFAVAGNRLPVGAGNDAEGGTGNDAEGGAGNDVEVGAGNDEE